MASHRMLRASERTLLDVLRDRSKVDIDSLDSRAARDLGPFVDSTSNQAIAYEELRKPGYRHIIRRAVADVVQHHAKRWPNIPPRVLAVEFATILLSLEMQKSGVKDKVHIQANPRDAYSTSRTVACGKRYLAMAQFVNNTFGPEHLSVKIASTWEGLMACKELQAAGIHTLATTLFTMEQAILAAEVGCSYIAPYVNELKVHFENGYVDPSPNLQLCVDIQRYYAEHGFSTMVLPASLTSTFEVMALAGSDHITVPPWLIEKLSEISEEVKDHPSLFDPAPETEPDSSLAQQVAQVVEVLCDGTDDIQASTTSANPSSTPAGRCDVTGDRQPDKTSANPTSMPAGRPDNSTGVNSTVNPRRYMDDEAGYRLAVIQNDRGAQVKKLIDAINIFNEKQSQLEDLVAPHVEEQSKN